MPDEYVVDDDAEQESAEETPAETPADKPAPAADKDSDITAQLRELRENSRNLGARLSEAEQNAKYWYEQAKGGKSAKAPEPEDDTDAAAGVDFVDAFSSNDPKRIADALDKLGYAKKNDVTRTVAKTAKQYSEEQRFFRDYEGIGDPESDLFKTATKHFNALVGEGEDRDDPRTLRTAARLAKVELSAKPKESEQDRNRRVNSQQGSEGRRPTRNAADNDDELSPAQRRIVDNLAAAGANINYDDYKKHAKNIRMAGAPMRRA